VEGGRPSTLLNTCDLFVLLKSLLYSLSPDLLYGDWDLVPGAFLIPSLAEPTFSSDLCGLGGRFCGPLLPPLACMVGGAPLLTGEGLEVDGCGCEEGRGGGWEEEEEDVVVEVEEVEGEEGEGVEVTGEEVEGREAAEEEETGTAVRGFEGAGVILVTVLLLSFCPDCDNRLPTPWETMAVEEEEEEEEEVLGAESFSAGEGVVVGVVTGGFPAGGVADVSLRCFPFTMSARLETP
jgi:hypothetical protein